MDKTLATLKRSTFTSLQPRKRMRKAYSVKCPSKEEAFFQSLLVEKDHGEGKSLERST